MTLMKLSGGSMVRRAALAPTELEPSTSTILMLLAASWNGSGFSFLGSQTSLL
jgi:hypothetical protein